MAFVSDRVHHVKPAVPMGEAEKHLRVPGLQVNCYQDHLCWEWVGHLKFRPYIPIPHYLRLDKVRFSVVGVGYHVLALRRPEQFGWRPNPRRGFWNASLKSREVPGPPLPGMPRFEPPRHHIATEFGTAFGIRPAGVARLWELNNGGLWTLPEMGDEIRRMMTDPEYFTIDPLGDYEPALAQVVQSPGAD